jgi:hypothetical protein
MRSNNAFSSPCLAACPEVEVRRPLTGYNHNVRHGDAVYHVQTEDNASRHEVVTDVFADGGRVIASRSTSYADALTTGDLDAFVRALMQRQHKAFVMAVRSGSLEGTATGS